MEKIFCLFSVLLLSGLVGVNSLECFVCFNCTAPSADDLRTCGEPVTTTQPPTVPSTTGIPSSPSTIASSTTSASSTTPSSTTTSSTTPSTTTTSSTTPSTTTSSSTTPSTTTTSSTTPSTTTTSSTTPSTTTTSTTTTTTEAPVDPPVNPPVSLGPEGRWKRNAISPVAVSSVSQFEDVEYVCYKVTAVLNTETVIERGCAPEVINDKELCENDVIKNVTTSCSTCKTDKCNGSYAVQFSSALLAAALIGVLFSK